MGQQTSYKTLINWDAVDHDSLALQLRSCNIMKPAIPGWLVHAKTHTDSHKTSQLALVGQDGQEISPQCTPEHHNT